jgi:hypothetical protein
MAAHENGLRLPRPIFLQSGVEDSALGLGEHKVAFLHTGRQICHAVW